MPPSTPAVDLDPSAPVAAAPPKAPDKRKELRNSLWCVHKSGRVGMIGEMGQPISFHMLNSNGELDAATKVEPGELRIARAEELPAHLDYTREQLVDLGYTDEA